MKNTWNHEYYEMLEFFYWEPQHLGKKKNPNSKYDTLEKSFEHLQKMEVTLNHIFNFFFKLISDNLRNEILSKFFGVDISDDFVFSSRDAREFIESFGTVTQPDMLFLGKKHILFIEMKIDSKTSLDQFMKYLILSLVSDERSKKKRKLSLLYISPYKFNKLFVEKFASYEEMMQMFMEMRLPDKSKNGGMNLRPYHNRIKKLAKSMNFACCTYSDLYKFLKSKEKEQDAITQKLIQGMCDELETRGLSKFM